MEMKKVLKVILIRSGILLSLLVVLIMAIKTLFEVPTGVPEKEKVLAVLIAEEVGEHSLLIKGMKDGMVFNGLKYTTKSYALISLIRDTSLIYCIDPCLAERIIGKERLDPSYRMIGYSYIDKPQENYTGIYCGLDWKSIFPIYQKIMPRAKRWGIIYTEGSCDGEKQAFALKGVVEMRPYMNARIQVIDHFGKDIEETILELATDVDAVYAVSRDRIIQAHLETIIQLCHQNKIPVIGGGIFGPQKGAVVSFAHDPYRIGRKSSDILRQLEQGKSMSEIEIITVEPELYINLTSAYYLGLDIPSDIRKNAKKIYN